MFADGWAKGENAFLTGYSIRLGAAIDVRRREGAATKKCSGFLIPIYGPLDVALRVILTGDFDFDGDVDGQDFLVWQRGGSPYPLSAGDLAAWETHYGSFAPLAATSATVPEPATGILLLLGMAALFVRRHTCETFRLTRIFHPE